MTKEELEWKKFELEQKVQLEELEIKRKELELKVQEQKSKQLLSPVLLTLIGGIITILTGLVLKYSENKMAIQMEDRKFQSSLLLKAVESKNYNEFSDMILAFQENGLLTLDSSKIRNFRKKRFISASLATGTSADSVPEGDPPVAVAKTPTARLCPPYCNQSETPSTGVATSTWIIVAGGDKTLTSARFEVKKIQKKGLGEARLWLRDGYYRTCIGAYPTYDEGLADLFEIRENINRTAYLARLEKWCPGVSWDKQAQLYKCP